MPKQSGPVYVASEIDRMRVALDLPDSISKLAFRYLQQVVGHEDIDIDSHDRLASTVLYITCRTQDVTVKLDDILTVTRPNVSRKSIVAKAKKIQQALSIGLSLRDGVEFTEKYCRELGLDEETTNEIVELAEDMQEKEVLVNNQVGTFAGSVIYVYGRKNDLEITQGEIADVVGVTEVTIRNNYKEVIDALEEEVPPSMNQLDTVDAGLKKLATLSDTIADHARELWQQTDYEPARGASNAGIAAAAFLLAAESTHQDVELEEVLSKVGVSQQTAQDHLQLIREGL